MVYGLSLTASLKLIPGIHMLVANELHRHGYILTSWITTFVGPVVPLSDFPRQNVCGHRRVHGTRRQFQAARAPPRRRGTMYQHSDSDERLPRAGPLPRHPSTVPSCPCASPVAIRNDVPAQRQRRKVTGYRAARRAAAFTLYQRSAPPPSAVRSQTNEAETATVKERTLLIYCTVRLRQTIRSSSYPPPPPSVNRDAHRPPPRPHPRRA
ncbi:uncharacterized protein LOC133883921 [Phragmites australis]|uniref:uncharacterized protein LOC133883921 n=1 Tax=Phragmites australis TaxID=29695 RepID=UPI002D76C508|nr:uncharacterized protein LOC133883921 [Phragmites australis]